MFVLYFELVSRYRCLFIECYPRFIHFKTLHPTSSSSSLSYKRDHPPPHHHRSRHLDFNPSSRKSSISFPSCYYFFTNDVPLYTPRRALQFNVQIVQRTKKHMLQDAPRKHRRSRVPRQPWPGRAPALPSSADRVNPSRRSCRNY